MGNGDKVNSFDSFLYAYDDAGNYDVTLTVTTLAGCSYDSSVSVNIHPLPYADFDLTPQETNVFEPFVNITDFSSGADSMIYLISDGSIYINEPNTVHEFLDSGTYQVKQWVSTQYGCLDSFSKEIFIDYAYKLYIPNAFSPNDDGINDVFKPKGFGLLSYEMMIYNRWGEMVYKSMGPNIPWNGKDAIQGYYMYQIKAIDYEGGVHNYSGVVYLLQ